MNRIDLQGNTLLGPTGTSPVLDPLAVLRLNNRLYIFLGLTVDGTVENLI